MKPERVDARDVLDPNAKTARVFSARVVGHFVHSGPNAWDDYIFAPLADGETFAVMADVPVQTEGASARFRMRRHGEVLRLEWQPQAGELAADADPQLVFAAACVRPWGEDPGRGAAAVIAEKLSETSPKPSLD